MNKRLKELAEQADVYAEPLRFSLGNQNYQQVRDERFAELIRADEREACAMLCDVMAKHPEYAESATTKLAAAAIRARGEK